MFVKFLLTIILLLCTNSYNESRSKPAFIPTTFDGAEVNVDVESLDLTSEWISREVFYDGNYTEEIEYLNNKYPGSYCAIRYSYGKIIRFYCRTNNAKQAVPLKIKDIISWDSSVSETIEVLGEPFTKEEHEDNCCVLKYISNDKSTIAAFTFVDGSLTDYCFESVLLTDY